MENLIFREMTEADWPRVAEIYAYWVEEGSATFNTVCPSYEQWNAAHWPVGRIVCEVDGIVRGWTSLCQFRTIKAYHGVAEISIYIDPDFTGKGIGTKLLQYALEDSKKHGFWSIQSAIFSKNEASIALHKKCGFRVVGTWERVAQDRFGEWLDTTLMELRF